jgi:hypothetical protein
MLSEREESKPTHNDEAANFKNVRDDEARLVPSGIYLHPRPTQQSTATREIGNSGSKETREGSCNSSRNLHSPSQSMQRSAGGQILPLTKKRETR